MGGATELEIAVLPGADIRDPPMAKVRSPILTLLGCIAA